MKKGSACPAKSSCGSAVTPVMSHHTSQCLLVQGRPGPRSHQRRWSADLFRCGPSPVSSVKKSLTEPPSPQQRVSLLRSQSPTHSSCKRYSCPPTGISATRLSSSSSSSSSSCSSPPPVPTSVITGPDPLGWKLRPKSCSSLRSRSNRLSLPVSIPVVESSPTPDADSASQLDLTPKTKPVPGPKPFRRHHSDSSAFLRSLESPLPVVTLKELRSVCLHPVTQQEESEDVFQEKVTTRPHKIPPAVPIKTPMAVQMARLIAHSHQHQRCDTAQVQQEENLYASVIKQKPKPGQPNSKSSRHAAAIGSSLDRSCDRERTAPRFPG